MTYSSVSTEKVIFDGGSQRQLLEQFVNSVEKRVLIIDIFFQF